MPEEAMVAQVTPSWFAVLVLLKYRTKSNYRSIAYLGPRLVAKLVFALLIMTVRAALRASYKIIFYLLSSHMWCIGRLKE